MMFVFVFFFSSRRRHTRYIGDWSSDVCSSDLPRPGDCQARAAAPRRDARGPEHARQRQHLHVRSEERRVGKECRSRWSPYQQKKKTRKEKIRSTKRIKRSQKTIKAHKRNTSKQ